ncbi:MAG: DUF402 domain-containing protein [Ktedonobacteraceae bacterium]
MVTVVKLNPQGEEKIHYDGDIVEQDVLHVVIQARWTRKRHDLGYVVFEPGDRFTEYYYTHRWYNIFDIATEDGKRKGWYCNVAEPALIMAERIAQVDLLLDVWVEPDGASLVLDEDEFAADTTLTDEQRSGAKEGLQALLRLIADRQEVFSTIEHKEK